MQSDTLAFSNTYLLALLQHVPARGYNHSYELYALPPLAAHLKDDQPGQEFQLGRGDSLLTGSSLPRGEKVLLPSQKMKWLLPIVLARVIPDLVGCSSRFQIESLLPSQYVRLVGSSQMLFSNLLSPPKRGQGSYM